MAVADEDEAAKRDYYLAKAAEAESKAAEAADSETRNKWLAIAQGYRSMLVQKPQPKPR
jgi:hypothetical protein